MTPGEQDRAADRLAAALVAAMAPVAASAERVVSTAATPEQVDLVVELGALSLALTEHGRRVMVGEPADWAELADQLCDAAKACRRLVVLDLDDAGDAGGR